ncbi:selenium cofactor biosynthesis protein YqeC [Promineifilum sp.]|uniref:selenium cofactor biosynthesis protein YqeC n=1 Tax=Promineifilum sp. TaxID=2664178 RepID=UPI0035B0EB1F
MDEPHWTLRAALGLGQRPELVALVGGGGKTGLLFALAAELPGRTVITTTTRIFAAQIRLAPAVCYADDLEPLGRLLDAHRVCLVINRVEGDKALGVPPDLPARLLSRPDVDTVLVEADGSRMRPVKAPAEHEPVIPPGMTLVVPVAGLDALEGPLDRVAHRPEMVRALLEEPPTADGRPPLKDGRLTPAGLARLLTHPNGGLKGAPADARVIPFLNKVESESRLAAARTAARLMLREPRVSRVVLASLHSDQPVREVRRRVTAVVLAAGESRRMGRNKLLLPWGDSTVLGRTLANVRASDVDDVLLVTGHEREKVEAIITQHPTFCIHNGDYANGMLSSVQAALRALPAQTEAILAILGDQPMVEPAVLDALLAAYAATPKGLVAPYYRGARGNPVIIDRRYFDELLALPPDAAPRALLRRHPDDVRPVEVESEAILHDLDRPEEYERWRP